MEVKELLWRKFQSRYARLLNRLQKKEQKQYYRIFSFKNELESNFDFNNINHLYYNFVEQRKKEKKRSKYRRTKAGIQEEKIQKAILSQAAKAFAEELFENRSKFYVIDKSTINRTKILIKDTSSGCKFYPCGNGK